MTTPYEHFKQCGPFCKHVEFCARCIDCFGFCGVCDADDAISSGCYWRGDERAHENPSISLDGTD